MIPPEGFKFSHITDGQEVWVPEDDPKSATVWMRPIQARIFALPSMKFGHHSVIRIHFPGLHDGSAMQFDSEFVGTRDEAEEMAVKISKIVPGLKYHPPVPTSGDGERGT